MTATWCRRMSSSTGPLGPPRRTHGRAAGAAGEPTTGQAAVDGSSRRPPAMVGGRMMSAATQAGGKGLSLLTVSVESLLERLVFQPMALRTRGDPRGAH